MIYAHHKDDWSQNDFIQSIYLSTIVTVDVGSVVNIFFPLAVDLRLTVWLPLHEWLQLQRNQSKTVHFRLRYSSWLYFCPFALASSILVQWPSSILHDQLVFADNLLDAYTSRVYCISRDQHCYYLRGCGCFVREKQEANRMSFSKR